MSEFAITTHVDLKSQLNAFFTGIGWTVTGTSADPIVAPVGGTKSYAFTAFADGLLVADASDSSFAARSNAPIGAGAGTASSPTRLFAYGESDWAALIIQYGFNLYRHIYVGVIDKIGNYTAGDILNCNNQIPTSGATSLAGGTNSFLFDCQDSQPSGGVNLLHPSLTQPIKTFKNMRQDALNISNSQKQKNGVSGCYTGPTETARRMAEAPVPGGVVLVPYTLVVTDQPEPNTLMIPIGSLKGVRATNIRSITSEDERSIGADTWKFFPEYAKTDARTYAPATGDALTSGGMSHYMGIAYKKVG